MGLVFPPGLEPGTFRVLGERDNHYTTETVKKILQTLERNLTFETMYANINRDHLLKLFPSIAQLVERWTVVVLMFDRNP